MELNVNINPEDINKLVANAVLESAIGTEVRRVIDKTVKELSTTYNNPIETVVKNAIAEIIRTVIIEQHHDVLKKQLEAEIAKQLTSEFVLKIVDRGLRRYD